MIQFDQKVVECIEDARWPELTNQVIAELEVRASRAHDRNQVDSLVSQNQLLTIPAVDMNGDLIGGNDTENQVVERFMEASRELVPSVQITLAKRIIRPGSNKVVCLAARTSIPLRDDEVASVSELALRLSDGTNVALSLSFFNDEGGEYSPLKRYAYSPSNYTEKNQSNLGFVLIGMAMVFITGAFAIANKSTDSFLPSLGHKTVITAQTKEAAKSTKSAESLTAFANGSSLKFSPAATTTTKTTPKPTAKFTSSATSSGTSTLTRSRQSVTNGHTRTTRPTSSTSASESHGQTLVPPPPPTPYIMPYGNIMPYDPLTGAPQFNQLNQALQKSDSRTESATKSASPHSRTESARLAGSPKAIEAKAHDSAVELTTQTSSQVSSQASSQASAQASAQAQAPAQISEIKALPQSPQDISIIEPRTYRPREATFWPAKETSSTNHSAPAPGTELTTPQLERIVPLLHDLPDPSSF